MLYWSVRLKLVLELRLQAAFGQDTRQHPCHRRVRRRAALAPLGRWMAMRRWSGDRCCSRPGWPLTVVTTKELRCAHGQEVDFDIHEQHRVVTRRKGYP